MVYFNKEQTRAISRIIRCYMENTCHGDFGCDDEMAHYCMNYRSTTIKNIEKDVEALDGELIDMIAEKEILRTLKQTLEDERVAANLYYGEDEQIFIDEYKKAKPYLDEKEIEDENS